MTSVEATYLDLMESIANAAWWLVQSPSKERLDRLKQALENWDEDYALKEGDGRNEEPDVKMHYLVKMRHAMKETRSELMACAEVLGHSEVYDQLKAMKC